MGPEAEIQTRILLAFGSLPWLRIWRANTGKANMAKPTRENPRPAPRWVIFGVPGQPDIMGLMLPYGRAVGIEVKSATGRQREEQVRFEAMWTKFGGLYVLARSVTDVVRAFEAQGVRRSELPAYGD